MFHDFQKPSGTDYTATVAFTLIALIVSPVILAVSRPVGGWDVLMAGALSTVSLGIAWASWKHHSRLTIPTLEPAPARSRS